METRSYISYLDYSLPEARVTISGILSNGPLSDRDEAQISVKLLGDVFPKQKLIASLEPMSSMCMGDRKNEADIFVEMLTRMFASDAALPSEIGYIIYARGNSISRGDPWALHSDEQCVNVPYFLQHKMKMAKAVVFNVEQECTGSFTALKIAKLLAEHGEAEKVLILSSNYFELNQKRLMGGSVFIGDGQGMMLISKSPGRIEIIDGIGRTDGSIDSVNSFLQSTNQETVVKVGCSLMSELLDKHGLSFDDVLLLVPLNTTPFVWSHYAKRLGISLKKVFFENMGKGGHVGDVDLIRNLMDISSKVGFPDGYLVVYGVATGTSWSAFLLRTCALKVKSGQHDLESVSSTA
jgi:3-oxoacyl-[acyl-carrier-protein] synthase-3